MASKQYGRGVRERVEAKEPSDGRGTRVAGMVGPAKDDMAARLEAAEAANRSLAFLLEQVADNLARLSCEIRARVKPT